MTQAHPSPRQAMDSLDEHNASATTMARRAMGAAVRTHRVRLALTQRRLAELVYCSQAGISKIERGLASVDETMRSRLEAALGLEAGQLLAEGGVAAPFPAADLVRRIETLEGAVEALTGQIDDLRLVQRRSELRRLARDRAAQAP